MLFLPKALSHRPLSQFKYFFSPTYLFSASKKKRPIPIENAEHINQHSLIPASENPVVVYVKEMVHTVKLGSKKSYADFKLYRSIRRIKKGKPGLWTAFELHEVRRIKKEVIKLIPFSVFMIVPFAEFVLPFYIILFPNAYPTHFLTPNQKKNKTKTVEKYQSDAQAILLDQLRSVLILNGVDIHDLLEKDVNKQRKLLEENKDFLEHHLDLRQMNSDNLLLLCKLFATETITGTHLLTEILKHTVNSPRYILNLLCFITRSKKRFQWTHLFFNYQVKLNFFPLEFFKKKLLLYQIEKNIKELRAQDSAYLAHGFDYTTAEVNPDFLIDFGRERGFRCQEDDEIEEWAKGFLSWVKGNMSNNLYIWHCVLNYKV